MQLKINLIIVFILLAISASPVLAQTAGPELNSAVQTSQDSTTPSLNFTGCARVDVPVTNAAYEQQVIELVNQARWDNGQLPPLKRNANLDLAARFHAQDMHDDSYFEHDSYDGSGGTTQVCSWSSRISNWYSGWNSLAENIAWGQSSPEQVVSAWMGSTGHRANILNPNLHEIGVGYIAPYWVQDFGSVSSGYPVVINREAASINNINSSLFLYGDSLQFPTMRIKNDNGAWSDWMPFQQNVSWNLMSLSGLRTVTVELRRANGTTVSASDTITLTKTSPQLGGVPDRLDYMYNIAQKKWISGPKNLQPVNIGNDDAMDWTVSTNAAWINVNQMNGITPTTSLTVSVSVNLTQPGNYDSSLTITVRQPADTAGAPKTIPIHVQVVNFTHQVFLPALLR